MLTLKDLMIGDWFYWEINGKNYPTQVCEETFGLTTETISNFHPIPITKEILEKNGFETHQSGVRMFFEHDDYRLCYYLNSINRFTSFNNIDGSLVQRVIVNVHELQHALKICGIDKEIIL